MVDIHVALWFRKQCFIWIQISLRFKTGQKPAIPHALLESCDPPLLHVACLTNQGWYNSKPSFDQADRHDTVLLDGRDSNIWTLLWAFKWSQDYLDSMFCWKVVSSFLFFKMPGWKESEIVLDSNSSQFGEQVIYHFLLFSKISIETWQTLAVLILGEFHTEWWSLQNVIKIAVQTLLRTHPLCAMKYLEQPK